MRFSGPAGRIGLALVIVATIGLLATYLVELSDVWDEANQAASSNEDASPWKLAWFQSKTGSYEEGGVKVNTIIANGTQKQDKIIVMGKLKTEDTTWVKKDLPDWQSAIYVVDDPEAPLHTPKNKGKEGMAYLTYIIDNYPNFPSTIAFVHAHKNGWPQAWHVDEPNHNNPASLQMLRVDTVQQQGYVNLRCQWGPGCPREVLPFRHPPNLEKPVELIYSNAWLYIFNNTNVPKEVGVACCAQFAVSRNQILQRPKEDYEKMRQWILDVKVDDDTSGRVLEYLWHIIFGRDSVYCPDMTKCYCDVFGQC